MPIAAHTATVRTSPPLSTSCTPAPLRRWTDPSQYLALRWTCLIPFYTAFRAQSIISFLAGPGMHFGSLHECYLLPTLTHGISLLPACRIKSIRMRWISWRPFRLQPLLHDCPSLAPSFAPIASPYAPMSYRAGVLCHSPSAHWVPVPTFCPLSLPLSLALAYCPLLLLVCFYAADALLLPVPHWFLLHIHSFACMSDRHASCPRKCSMQLEPGKVVPRRIVVQWGYGSPIARASLPPRCPTESHEGLARPVTFVNTQGVVTACLALSPSVPKSIDRE